MMEGTSPIELVRIPDAYRQWNRILIDELFPEGRLGTPVYLSIHAGLLDELGARHGRGGRDDFVASVLALAPRSRFFNELSFYWEIWDDNRRREPPFVAGLALAVLAVGDMDNDESATAANYYVRLNALLGTPGRERPDKFEDTVALWRSLQGWLHKERRGELVLRGLGGARPYVDAVSSQCLVRSCDLDTLANAVRTFSGVVTTSIDPEDAAPALARWLAGAGSRSRLARLLGPRPDGAALLQAAEALSDALEKWTPTNTSHVAAPRLARVSPATLALRPNRYPNLMWRRAEWLLRVLATPDAEEAELLVQVGERVLVALLDLREPASYDALISADEAGRILRGQMVVLDDSGADITPRRESIIWFEDGAMRGRQGSWTSVSVPRADSPHAVVALTAEALAEAQRRATQPGSLLLATESWPGGGLFAAHSVSLSPGTQLPGNVFVAAHLEGLRLTGGLLLRRRVYLRGGLPALVVPDDAATRVVHLADAAESIIRAADFRQLELREGPYRVDCGGTETSIFVTEPRWRESQAAEAAALDHDVARSVPTLRLRGAIPEIVEERHATHVRPGLTYRLYTTAMLKGDSRSDGGIQEIVTKVRPRDFVMIRNVPASGPLPRADCFEQSAETVEVGSAGATDRLLEFVSARAEGSVELLRSYCSSVSAGSSWHSVVTTLEDLGHVDVGWNSRRWFAAPAAAVPRAADPSLSVFVGVRARETLQWLLDHHIRAKVSEPSGSGRVAMPAVIVAPTEDVLRVATELVRMNVLVLPESPASILATHALPITDSSWWAGQEFTPSSRVRRSLDRWNPESLQWRSYPEGAIDGPALYRWRENGVRMHYYASRTLSCSVRDFAAIKWNLAPRTRSFVVYQPHLQRLLVPLAMGLPRVLRRACTVALGLPPLKLGRALAYDGVPLSLARTVAVRLNQTKAEGLW